MSLIDVGEVQLDCERSGTGAPLLMIMGMSGTALSWSEEFLERLRADFELIVYDHRGVGASSRLTGPLTIAQMAADAGGLLDALGLQAAHVLGISMGGMIAQELALAHPERVRTLVLGCTYCGGPRSVRLAGAAVRRLLQARAAGDREGVLRASWEINVSPAFAGDDEQWQAFRERALRRPVAVAVIERQAGAIAAHDTSARLTGLDAPTLVIHGSADQLLPVANAHLLAELIPHARLEILDGAGHLFFLEAPERAAALVGAHAGVHA